VNLREKHAKHLADLRAYYEEEMQQLRQALNPDLDKASEVLQLQANNRQLSDHCTHLDTQLERTQR
jgi:M-phase phosphoprotein 9